MTAMIEVTTALIFVSISLISYFLVVYNWRRRWLYYYGSKLNGPLSLPLIGSALTFVGSYTDIHEKIIRLCKRQPSVFRVWLGPMLIIVNSKPEDLEVLLNTHLDKSPSYHHFIGDMFKEGLLTAPVDLWKRHRKIVSTSFSQQTLNSLVEIFVRRTNKLVNDLDSKCEKGYFDIMPIIWRCTLDVAVESLCDLSPDMITGQNEYLVNIKRMQEIVVIRERNPLLHSNLIWSMTSTCEEWKKLCAATLGFCRNVIDTNVSKLNEVNDLDEDDVRKKRLLNNLNVLNVDHREYTERQLMDEMQTMFVGASETSAITDSVTFSLLGIYQDVQDKVYQELHSIFGGSLREPTAADLNRMEYLERVIKESMRLFPAAPIIMRHVDRDVEINNCFYPKGSSVAVPIMYVQRKEELWEDPWSFNPDRFLPENVEKRLRCAYLPFSFGLRNCVGFKFAMMSMKVLVSNVLRNYRVVSSYYKCLEDIKVVLYSFVGKPIHGSRIVLERRNVCK